MNIGVIGTGETAAIAVALVDALRRSVFIEVISPSGVIYSRDESFEENRLFSDPDGKLASLFDTHQHAGNWLQLSTRDRREFVRRIHSTGTSVRVESEYNGKVQDDAYEYMVVARGFDALWFRHLLDQVNYACLTEVTHL